MIFVGVRQSLEKTRFGKALKGSLHRSRTHTTMSYHINRGQQFLMLGGTFRSVNQHLVASCAIHGWSYLTPLIQLRIS